MLFRVVLITLVLGTTVALHLASPQELALPGAVWLFAIVAATYTLTLAYALWLKRATRPILLGDAQVMGDLVITTALVHVTGGAQSGYVFFYPLSIIGAALVRHRRGAQVAAAASVGLFFAVALAGWMRWLPTPEGLRLEPWDLPRWALIRALVLNGAAFVAVGFLAAKLGEQLAHAGARLERQQARTADLAALNEDIIRCLSSGLVTVDGAGVVLTVNQAAAEILGLAPVEARGRRIGDLVPELDDLLHRTDGRGPTRRAELAARRRRAGADVEVPLGVSVSPLANHRGQPIGRIINFQDLTELRRMEAQVKRGERLAAIGQMAAGVAHEIRNPLASISGSIELLKSAPQVGDDNRNLMEIVLREVDRLNGLVTDLLEYARPRERVPVPIELAALLGETVQVFAQDRTNTAVTVRFAPEAAAVGLVAHADPAQLRQVVWNLLRNGAEAMPAGGEVVVELRGAGDAGGTWAEIAITDQGAGIAPEELERIFDPFYTTKPSGSGLGLATVHRIVTEHGGTIAVASAPKRGTRMTVRLPLGAAPSIMRA